MAWENVEHISFEEKMLWVGVLRRAIFDYVLYKGSGRNRLRWQRSHAYIFDEDHDYGDALSFEVVCGLFGWEPDYIRRLVKKLTKSDIKKLESSRFRDDFDTEAALGEVLRGIKWDIVKASTPFFPPYNYSQEYRTQLRLKMVVKRPSWKTSPVVPLHGWSSTVGVSAVV